MLRRALWSVLAQTRLPRAVIVEFDGDHTGAAATKNRALARVDTEWVAWLDDDDQFLPLHLEALATAQQATGADVIYPWPVMDGADDPRPDRFGKPFDAAELRRGSYIPTTSLFRTSLAKAAGGFRSPPGSNYDDWGLYLGMLERGATFFHLPVRTWVWNVRPGMNTSGQPDRW